MTNMLDCTAAMRQLWDYLDGELTAEREALVRAHLEQCSRCVPHADFETRFLEALASTRRMDPAPAGLREAVIARLREVGFTPG